MKGIKEKERVLLVGVNLNTNKGFKIESSMKELEELVKAAEGNPISSIIQNKDRIDTTYYIGKGKAIEISNYCDELDIDTVVFNDQLSGAQLRNLEEKIDRKIIDRTSLILDIFANRANTKEGKLQVELAQLKYRLPRLTGFGTELSRLGGGIGTRGPGEKKLEIDRRHIEARIDEIRNRLKELKTIRKVKRKNRLSSDLPIIALVGYTNAGKSTLFNKMIKKSKEYTEEKDVYTKDMLFATLDTTLRKTNLPNGQQSLLIDTVGFVSKLPTHLIEAFKGTLEEVKYADVLLHVVDSTNEDLDIQIKTTLDILKELDVTDKPIITVFNKTDKKDLKEVDYDLEGEKVFVSALEEKNLDELWMKVEEALSDEFYEVELLIPYSDADVSSYIFNKYNVKRFKHTEDGTNIEVTLNNKDYNKYQEYIIG